MRFEIRYFFLEIGLSPLGLTKPQEKVSNFKPHYMLSLSTGLRAPVCSACNNALECGQHYVRVCAMEYFTGKPISICTFFYNEYVTYIWILLATFWWWWWWGGGAQTMTKIIFFKEILSSNYMCLFKNQKKWKGLTLLVTDCVFIPYCYFFQVQGVF